MNTWKFICWTNIKINIRDQITTTILIKKKYLIMQ